MLPKACLNRKKARTSGGGEKLGELVVESRHRFPHLREIAGQIVDLAKRYFPLRYVIEEAIVDALYVQFPKPGTKRPPQIVVCPRPCGGKILQFWAFDLLQPLNGRSSLLTEGKKSRLALFLAGYRFEHLGG